MKKIYLLMLLICFLSIPALSYSKVGLGINVGGAVPNGQLAKMQGSGFQFGFFGRIPINHPYFSIKFGIDYPVLSGMDTRESLQGYTFKNAKDYFYKFLNQFFLEIHQI